MEENKKETALEEQLIKLFGTVKSKPIEFSNYTLAMPFCPFCPYSIS